MSNNWDENTLSMVQLIQFDIDNNSEWYKMVKRDEAQRHPIHIDKHGTLRWVMDPMIGKMWDLGGIDLNKLMANSDKNDPLIRDLFRQMGYSLHGYWEIFHWDVNNPKANEYNASNGALL